MKSLQDILRAQHAQRPTYDDPLVERLFTELMGLGEEVCVLRDRLDTMESLIAEGTLADKQIVDAVVLEPQEIERRLKRHRDWFEQLLIRLSDPDSAR